MPICARCNKESRAITGSFFNEDLICLECRDIESLHPDYKKAKDIEHQEVVKGNYNFEGIGLPDDFDKFVQSLKK